LWFSSFSSNVFLSQVLFSWSRGKTLLKCLKALVFRVLSCVFFLLSKLWLLERLSMRSCYKGGNLHTWRKFMCFRGSFVHQGGLSEGIFWRLFSWHLLLLLIHIWSLIMSVCSLKRRIKTQDALEYNWNLPFV
jgi:hypothetical protein